MCAKATMEEFEALLNESFEIDTPAEGSVVKGKVIAIEAGQAIIDGEVVVTALPGHDGTWNEAGCDRQLVLRDGRWTVEPLKGD